MSTPGGVDWQVCPSSLLDHAARAGLRLLWGAAFGDDFTAEDERHCYGGHHAIGYADGQIAAHAAVVTREILVGEHPFQTGYVEGVAVLPAWWGRGLGTAVMGLLEPLLHAHHELGMLSTGRARGFYRRLGWEVWRGHSSVLRDGERISTDEEHGGLMVRRFGPSADVDLAAPVACHDRPGDAW